jgi:hypothetical protein
MVPRALALAGLLLGVVVACSSAAAPPPPSPANPSPSSPPPSSSPTTAGVLSVEDAVAAIGRFDSNFLGYRPRDPELIGQSAWFEANAVADGYEVTFFRGAGDCPAGCIDRSFIKFFVGRDGRVEKRCEWEQTSGEAPRGTPC